jgi:Fe2+ transport system protein B
MATEETVIETVEKPSRSSVIAEAVAAATEADSNEQTAEKEAKAATKVPEKNTTKVEETNDEDKTIAEQGRQLMLALKDPEKAPIVIKFLAEQAGYTKSEVIPQSKAEVKEMKNEILEDLREGLGEEFSIIADRLAPAIEKILNKQLEKSQADIREKFQEQETEKTRNQASAVITNLTTDFFGADAELPDEVSKEMSKFMDRVSPSPGSSIKEYVEDSFHFAIGKLGLQKPLDKKVAEKVQRNRIDASSRLASVRVPAASNLQKDNSKPMTRQEAIRAAIEAVEKEG